MREEEGLKFSIRQDGITASVMHNITMIGKKDSLFETIKFEIAHATWKIAYANAGPRYNVMRREYHKRNDLHRYRRRCTFADKGIMCKSDWPRNVVKFVTLRRRN